MRARLLPRRASGARHAWAVLGLTLAAAGLRFLTLDLQSFTHDEAVTAVRVLDRDFLGMLDQVVDTERSGPLYYLAAWSWEKAFGAGEVGLRALSALFGTLAVPVAYLAATELASRRAGVIAAGLVAFNPYLLWYSQEARSYELFVLLSAVALLFLAHAISRRSPRSLALWALASVASLATHYFAVFLVVPEALWLLYVLRGTRAWTAVGAVFAGGLALLPLVLLQTSGNTRNEFADDPLGQRFVDAGVKFSLGEEAGTGTELAGAGRAGLAIGALAAGLGIAALVLLARRGTPSEKRGGLVAGTVGVFAFALPFAIALAGLDLANPRNLIGALLPLLLAAAAGFGARAAGRLGLAGAAAMWAVFALGVAAVFATPALQRDDWRGIADAIGPAAAQRLVVASPSADDPLLLYLDGGVEKVRNVIAEIGRDRARAGRVRTREIVVVTRSGEPSGAPPGFDLVEELASGDLEGYRYASPEPRAIELSRLDGARLTGGDFTVLLQSPEGERRLSVGHALPGGGRRLSGRARPLHCGACPTAWTR